MAITRIISPSITGLTIPNTSINNASLNSVTALPSAVAVSNTPAFEAYLSSDQTISNNVTTKIQYNTEIYDTDSCYDNSSNYRFTPDVAGKYYVYSRSYVSANASSNYLTTNHIYKNGSQVTDAIIDVRNNAGLQFSVFVYATVIMNGSSDYVEAFSKSYVTGGSITVAGGGEQRNSFGAYRIIT